MHSMIKVFFDDSPLTSGHQHRGIGAYTRELVTALEKQNDVLITTDRKSPHDLVHYPYFDFFSASLPVVQTKPTVVTIHDAIPLEFPDYYKPGKKGALALYYQKLALRKVAAVLTDSHYSKNSITEKLGYPKAKITSIPLAASADFKPADREEIKAVHKKYHLPKKFLLYVGDINYNKNIPQLIKALKFLPEAVQLVLVGKNFTPQEIPEWSWIEAQVALSDVESRVQYLNEVDSQADLAAIYSSAAAYVQPSLSEGFGLPVLEAMRCNCPVVSSVAGSLPEVGGQFAWYAEPEAQSLAGVIESVLCLSATELEGRLQKATAWAKSFTWQKTAKLTATVYQQVVT
ncbi:MAG: glycosyltransferase family 1 protein [Patescibacteria group bacterium]